MYDFFAQIFFTWFVFISLYHHRSILLLNYWYYSYMRWYFLSTMLFLLVNYKIFISCFCWSSIIFTTSASVYIFDFFILTSSLWRLSFSFISLSNDSSLDVTLVWVDAETTFGSFWYIFWACYKTFWMSFLIGFRNIILMSSYIPILEIWILYEKLATETNSKGTLLRSSLLMLIVDWDIFSKYCDI